MVHKSICVIGKNGFIGSNIVKDLHGTGIDRSGYSNFLKKDFDVVINANGNSKKYLSLKEPLLDFDLSVRSTLQSILDFKYDLYIYLSSCEVYEDLTKNTLEESIINTSNISRYGLSKYMSECIVKNYCKKWVILRLNGPIGPNMKKGPIYDLMNNDDLWISIKSVMQLIDIKFISEFISILIEKNIFNETFNITGTDSICLEEVAQLLGSKSKFPDYPIITHNIDTNKANSILELPKSIKSVNSLI